MSFITNEEKIEKIISKYEDSGYKYVEDLCNWYYFDRNHSAPLRFEWGVKVIRGKGIKGLERFFIFVICIIGTDNAKVFPSHLHTLTPIFGI